MTTTAARKLAVESLEESAFSNEYAHEDIFVLKQGVYAEAEKQGILDVISTDDDLARRNGVRENVYERPQVPNVNASAATLKTFTVFHNLYQRQDDALRALKQKVLNTLDSTTMDVVKDPEDGVLHKSVRDILMELLTTYGTMTHAELHKLKLETRSKFRYIITFVIYPHNYFNNVLQFSLTSHNKPKSSQLCSFTPLFKIL